MSTYINSKGKKLDTSEMDDVHIERALLKAQSEGNHSNITALEEELKARNSK